MLKEYYRMHYTKHYNFHPANAMETTRQKVCFCPGRCLVEGRGVMPRGRGNGRHTYALQRLGVADLLRRLAPRQMPWQKLVSLVSTRWKGGKCVGGFPPGICQGKTRCTRSAPFPGPGIRTFRGPSPAAPKTAKIYGSCLTSLKVIFSTGTTVRGGS